MKSRHLVDQLGDARTREVVVGEDRATSASRSLLRSSIWAAGRWWNAPTTAASGTAWAIWAAIEPRGGYSGVSSLPSRARALTIEMTVLSASWSRSALTVATAESQGVATMTRSAAAAAALSPPVIDPVPELSVDATSRRARRVA